MRWLLGLLIVWATAALAGSALAESIRLQPYDSLDKTAVTVSGLSSGAFFANQMHVAYSGLIDGAGLIAGGPYDCAGQTASPWWLNLQPNARAIVAVSVCTRVARDAFDSWTTWWGPLPEAPDVDLSVDSVSIARADGAIDDPANLADDRVWLFSGTGDTVVPASTVQVLAAFYRRLGIDGSRLAVVDDVPAGHGLPVESFPGESRFPKLGCGDEAPPFIVTCGRDAAEQLLKHLYPDGFVDTPAVPRRDRLLPFDQAEFFDTADPTVSLAKVGYVYVPLACLDGETKCRLHVAFHGCQQGYEAVGDDFVWDGGYNRWAEANNIVVLYPQVVAWTPVWNPLGTISNPNGCWDWWGYSGTGYADNSGPQMQAVRAMIARLLAG